MQRFLFILSTPFSGSTLLHNLIGSSPNVASLPREGQHVEEASALMRGPHWDPGFEIPWSDVKSIWLKHWDTSLPILVEKSPPNLLRARAIESVFTPASFIVMIRNPYAFCEGINRRGFDLVSGARRWLMCAEFQIRNIQTLKHVTWFTYESLTESPTTARAQLLEFLPELGALSLDSVETFSILGREKSIRNMNRIKIDRLSADDIRAINDVLSEHQSSLEFFGYKLLEPSASRGLRSYRTKLACSVVRATRLGGLMPGPIVKSIEQLLLRI
jgi:hypothetical protein